MMPIRALATKQINVFMIPISDKITEPLDKNPSMDGMNESIVKNKIDVASRVAYRIGVWVG